MAGTRFLSKVLGDLGIYYKDYEVITELSPSYGLHVYRKMRLNDPIIGGIMFHIETVLRRVEFVLKGNVPSFVKDCLTETFFRKILGDLTSVLVYGFYCGEKIWKAENYVKLIDIEPRHQTTIDDIYDTYVTQCPDLGSCVDIPKAKLLWFYIMSDARYPYGISLLRSVYKPYFMKIAVEASEANSVDRDLAGLPTLTAPEGFNFAAADPDYPGYDPSIKDTLEWAINVVTSIRKDNQQGVVLPYGWELKLLRAEGTSSKANADTMIKRYNTEICIGLLEAFMSAGLGPSMQSSETELHLQTFLTACDSISRIFAEAINEQVLTQLCEYNGVECDCWIEPVPLTNYNLKDLASYVARLVSQEVIHPTKVLEDSLLKIANLPIEDLTDEK